jgi:hypothetical protein
LAGADRVFTLLERGEVGVDAGGVAVSFQHGEDALRRADRGAMGLRGIDAEAEPHPLQFIRGHHRGLAALKYIDQG